MNCELTSLNEMYRILRMTQTMVGVWRSQDYYLLSTLNDLNKLDSEIIRKTVLSMKFLGMTQKNLDYYKLLMMVSKVFRLTLNFYLNKSRILRGFEDWKFCFGKMGVEDEPSPSDFSKIVLQLLELNFIDKTIFDFLVRIQDFPESDRDKCREIFCNKEKHGFDSFLDTLRVVIQNEEKGSLLKKYPKAKRFVETVNEKSFEELFEIFKGFYQQNLKMILSLMKDNAPKNSVPYLIEYFWIIYFYNPDAVEKCFENSSIVDLLIFTKILIAMQNKSSDFQMILNFWLNYLIKKENYDRIFTKILSLKSIRLKDFFENKKKAPNSIFQKKLKSMLEMIQMSSMSINEIPSERFEQLESVITFLADSDVSEINKYKPDNAVIKYEHFEDHSKHLLNDVKEISSLLSIVKNLEYSFLDIKTISNFDYFFKKLHLNYFDDQLETADYLKSFYLPLIFYLLPIKEKLIEFYLIFRINNRRLIRALHQLSCIHHQYSHPYQKHRSVTPPKIRVVGHR